MPRVSWSEMVNGFPFLLAGSKPASSEELTGFAAVCICDRHLLGKD